MKIHNIVHKATLCMHWIIYICKIATLHKHHGGIRNTRAEVIMQIPLICLHLFLHYSHNHSISDCSIRVPYVTGLVGC